MPLNYSIKHILAVLIFCLMALKKLIPATFCLLLPALIAQAQQIKKQPLNLFVQWGYNRSHYLTSDIKLTGSNYNFTLYDVSATDDPSAFEADVYFNPAKLTIPQFNFRVGVLVNKWAYSIGWDHLKYRIRQGQTVKITGYISPEASDVYAGNYHVNDMVLYDDFLKMEHTDGLNFIHFNADRFFTVFQNPSGNIKAQLYAGIGTGAVTPWTDTRLFNTFYRNPSIHFAGWGFCAQAAPRLTFLNVVYIECALSVGYMYLWDILIERHKQNAQQQIVYSQRNFSLGFTLPLSKQ